MTSAEQFKGVAKGDAKQSLNSAGRRVYAFEYEGLNVENPAIDPRSQTVVSPQQYGFVVKEFAGGRTAWSRGFTNGTMLVLNPATKSHVLSDAEVVRVMFVSPGGELLQDAKYRIRTSARQPELATVRVTLNVAVDLLGATPEAAKAAVLRQIGHALAAGPVAGGTLEVLHHSFELSAVVSDTRETQDYSNTNFSQLLGM